MASSSSSQGQGKEQAMANESSSPQGQGKEQAMANESSSPQGQGQPKVQDPALMTQEDFFKYFDNMIDCIFQKIAKLPYLCHYCCKSYPNQLPKCLVCEKYTCERCSKFAFVSGIPMHCPRCVLHALRDVQELGFKF